MKSIYTKGAKKYEDLVKAIVTDADLDYIDFPLIANNFDFDRLSTLLPPELVEKLGGLQDEAEPYSPDAEVIKKDEEYKQSELDELNKDA